MTLPWDTFDKHHGAALPITSTVSGHDEDDHASLIVVGAGLAGCWLARCLAERGIRVRLIDQHGSVAAEASGNPAGIVKPFVTRSPCLAMAFHIAAHEFLVQQLTSLNLRKAAGYTDCGVLQLIHRDYPPSDHYHSQSAAEATIVAGHLLKCRALHFSSSGWLNPQLLCMALTEHPLIARKLGSPVVRLLPCNKPISDSTQNMLWRVRLGNGTELLTPHLVLATGSSTRNIFPMEAACLTPARGQISRFAVEPGSLRTRCVISGKHYVIPNGDSILVGATFDRNNTSCSISEQDHQANLTGLEQLLPGLAVDPTALDGYCGVRSTTPDRLPLVGPVPDWQQARDVYQGLRHGKPVASYPSLPSVRGLSVLGGLGSRGIVTAPLCAKLLADFIIGADEATESDSDSGVTRPVRLDSLEHWAPLLNPVRFLIRDLKRGIVRSSVERYNH